ncbi:2-phosphosulfolactate phosphatase [Fodinibius salsisoli]|uniref:Probable 2-phosphosulfolactate phosphatase n=1 Tax=Fodinibius salsisoli TaxID=2820877 RepID=A0ABT3PRF1_9BACT|nr:2-phosphosulfolactate phosphatase [Fodinibius salsisoli]MCW9708444.1 2-phosphosulfolactate phosphatase [Fodinibius salsisoli]
MNNKLDVFISSQSFQEEDLRDRTVVVLDVLRASSTIVTALHNGAKGVIPVGDMGDASKISQNLDSPHYLLSGEKDGVKIEGYDLGNSPLDYTTEKVESKTIIFNTTNGTKAIKRSGLATEVVIGSFLNLNTIVEYLQSIENDITLVCAGWRGRLALEDLLCAGNIIAELVNGTLPEYVQDGAKVAFGLYEKIGDDIEDAIRNSNYAIRLKDIVSEDDLRYCCKRNELKVLPVMKEGIISDFHGEKE